MTVYYRPLLQSDPVRPPQALDVSQDGLWAAWAERLQRGVSPSVVPVDGVPPEWRARWAPIKSTEAIMGQDGSAIMGILNVTPDSFSDGGLFQTESRAQQHVNDMVRFGAQIIDVGGESTRPGAKTVPIEEEIARTAPVIAAIRAAHPTLPISIDTRKAAVAKAALDAGATLVNDVSGFTFDPELAPLCAARGVPVCIMHAQGDPETMQQDPYYDDVVLDVYDFLQARVDALIQTGIQRHNIIVDPGIGFGKTLTHNLLILQRISIFHSLGTRVLLGASRKRFIGTISKVDQASERLPGSLAVALAAVKQGVQIVRVHDVPETQQAFALWRAVQNGEH